MLFKSTDENTLNVEANSWGVKKAVDSFMIDKEDALSTRGDTTQGIITKI